MKKTGLALAGGFVLLCAALPALASPIVVGTPSTGSGNCFPFSCGYNGEYQQVYTGSDFSGPITITGLEFSNTQYNSGTTAIAGTWTFDLSTTTAAWNTLSTTPASNIGSDNTQVFTGSISQAWAFGDTLTFVFATPFTFNPANGNLLLDVQASGVTSTGGNLFFDYDGSGSGVFGRYFNGQTATDGLVTGFMTNAQSVPEPGSLAVFGLGLGLLALGGFAASAKRRRSALA